MVLSALLVLALLVSALFVAPPGSSESDLVYFATTTLLQSSFVHIFVLYIASTSFFMALITSTSCGIFGCRSIISRCPQSP